MLQEILSLPNVEWLLLSASSTCQAKGGPQALQTAGSPALRSQVNDGHALSVLHIFLTAEVLSAYLLHGADLCENAEPLNGGSTKTKPQAD